MNKILNIKSKDVKKILININKKNSYLVRLDGNKIKTECELLRSIAYGFHFPIYSKNKKKYISWTPFTSKTSYSNINWDGMNDWMMDLSWIKSNSIHFIVFNYNSMLKDDSATRKYFNEYLIDTLLPWWEKEVIDCVVDGKTKDFMVYYID